MTRVDGQLFTDSNLALTANHAFQHNVISIWIDIERIANSNRLNQKAQFSRQFFTHTLDAVHQLTAGFRVDQGNQAVANFKANQVHLIDIVPIQFFGLIQRGLSCLFGGGGFWHIDLVGNAPSQTCRNQSQDKKNHVGHARHQTNDGQNGSRQVQGCRIGKLRGGLLGHGLGGGHAGHNDGSGQRQEKRWDLRHQTITNGQQGINFSGLRQ